MLTGGATMRPVLGVGVVILCLGCVTPRTTVTRTTVRRVVFSTLPSSSPALAGAPGVGLRLTTLTGVPVTTASDGAVSFPMFQPDLGVLVRLGKSSYLGGRVALGVPSFGAQPPTGGIAPAEMSAALDVSVGGGHDFQFTPIFGLSLSGELGIAGATLTKQMRALTSEGLAMPLARATVGFFAQPGPFRFYLGGTVGTAMTNDGLGTFTETCTFSCTATETGATGLDTVGLLGGGARWQANSIASVALEAWMPLSQQTRFPPMISLSLRLGDFATKPAPPRPLPPPPPPPQVTPEPEEAPVQL